MWIGVAAVTMLMVLWSMVGMLGVSPALGALATVLGLSGAWLWQAQKRQALLLAARSLETALIPDVPVVANHPQTRFAAVLADLKGRETGMEAALAEMPIYLAVGAENSGMRTLLQHAGLTWASRELRGVAGCTWWVANECAVLRTLNAQSAKAGLDALYRHRPDAPVNGFLLALSLEDLLTMTPTALRAQAQAQRHEVDVLQDILHTRAPLYLAVTKCDRLAGFLETFGGLGEEPRRRLLGRTSATDMAPVDRMAEQIDRLVLNLAERSLGVMHASTDATTRERIYQFPEQLATVRAPLLTWANAFFATSRRRATPRLRGMFLCSVASGKYAFDRLLVGATQSVRVPAAAVAPSPYFTQRIFSHGILPDRFLPTGVIAVARPPLARHLALAAACLLVMMPGLAYLKSSYELSRSREVVAQIEAERKTPESRLASLDSVDRLRLQIDRLASASEHASLLNEQSGMSQSSAMLDAVRNLYLRTVRDAVLQPMVAYDAQQMLGFVKRHAEAAEPPSDRDFKLFFDKLRAHLLLSGAHEPTEHVLDAADAQWLAESMSRRWARALGDDAAAATQHSTREHIAYYLQALPHQSDLRLARDMEAIVGMRRVLTRTDPAEALLVQAMDGAEGYTITLSQLLGDATIPLYSDAQIPGGLTRDGWENGVRNRLLALPARHDTWVLGHRMVARVAPYLEPGGIDALLTAYWTRYVDAWRAFMGSIQVVPGRDQDEAVAIMQKLQGDDAPGMQRIQQAVQYNLAPLKPTEASVGMAAAQEMTVSPEVVSVVSALTALKPLHETLRRPRLRVTEGELRRLVERLK